MRENIFIDVHQASRAYSAKTDHSVWIHRLICAFADRTSTDTFSHLTTDTDQGPVVQNIVSLMSSLVIKMLTVLVSTISNLQVFLLKKMWVAFANAKATHIFFSKNISIYAIFNDQSFNNMLTNDIVSFEQLGPDCMSLMVIAFCHSFLQYPFFSKQIRHGCLVDLGSWCLQCPFLTAWSILGNILDNKFQPV